MTSTNVWSMPVPCFAGDYASSEALTREDRTELAQTYRAAKISRFHSMNAGVLALEQTNVFYSYYTELARLFYNVHTEHFMLFISPFVYDTERYTNSRTSNRQLNRWLYENAIETDVRRIREYYELACKSDIGNASETFPTIYGYDPQHRNSNTVPVTLRFANEQHTLNVNGSIECELINARVPALTYNASDAHMFKVGTFVHRGNEFGLAYVRE